MIIINIIITFFKKLFSCHLIDFFLLEFGNEINNVVIIFFNRKITSKFTSLPITTLINFLHFNKKLYTPLVKIELNFTFGCLIIFDFILK